MDFNRLVNFKISELKTFAKEVGIEVKSMNKQMIIEALKYKLKKFEKYKEKQDKKYEKLRQIGNVGVDGTTYLVRTKVGEFYAMKTFAGNKSSESILLEARLQKLASKAGIAPKIIEVDTVLKFIVMEKMDKHLLDVMKEQNGELTKAQQHDIIRLFKQLDLCKVFHGDSNILNYMYSNSKLYMIDFGLSKLIDSKLQKKYNTDKPNMTLMLLGFVIKLQELKCPECSWKYLSPYIDEKERKKHNIV
jgi:tRNA A-37 threonylcarbamoyl transferase component Bud32